MLAEIENFMRQKEDFGFETTLSGRSDLNVTRRLRKRGYVVHLFYLWVPSVELALSRVRERVSRGGHDVAEAVVRRRFGRSIANFLVHYRLQGDRWIFYDNSAAVPANVLELPLLERATMALKAAVENAIEEHAREGLPMYIWRDGQVVAVPAEELRKKS
jgi:predicted ABC-type ATPase